MAIVRADASTRRFFVAPTVRSGVPKNQPWISPELPFKREFWQIPLRILHYAAERRNNVNVSMPTQRPDRGLKLHT